MVQIKSVHELSQTNWWFKDDESGAIKLRCNFKPTPLCTATNKKTNQRNDDDDEIE